MHKKRRQHSSSSNRGILYDLGRVFFPDLIQRPRAMRVRMVIMTLGMAALLVGMLVGFYHRANTPAEVLFIQARQLNR